ncbi:MAG: orotate phosphoribosyltransferase [Deltaproteobacteria bacterium]|nr:orotate phosphoribosyltransferase [Deltaproteobacteria bacterium]
MDNQNPFQRLLEILLERSFEKRRVVLASGRVSDYYIDCRETSLNPEGAYLVGRVFLERLQQGPTVEAVAGVTLGGDPLVTAIAVVSHLQGSPLPAIIVRKQEKEHGKGGALVGASGIKTGTRIALVEDVVTTGGSVIRAIDKLKGAGFNVIRVLCLVDREEGGSQSLKNMGFELEAIFRKNDFMAREA